MYCNPILPQIKKIELIWNSNLQRMFQGKIETLSDRSTQAVFSPKWHLESNNNRVLRFDLNNLLS